MTIDAAIKYADMMADTGLAVFGITVNDLQSLGALCANALRLAKRMSEENGLTEEVEKVMKKKDEIEIEKACESLAEKVVNLLFPEENAMHPKQEPEQVNAVPDTWQDRMKREYHETKERYEKLHRMITKYEAGVLEFTPNCSIELLKQQKRHMGEYLHDLEIRAEIEGVKLYEEANSQ